MYLSVLHMYLCVCLHVCVYVFAFSLQCHLSISACELVDQQFVDPILCGLPLFPFTLVLTILQMSPAPTPFYPPPRC